jgi:hypothetical protein
MILRTRVPFEERARFMLNSMCPYPDSPDFAAALSAPEDFASIYAMLDVIGGGT